jgi:geranylgeranyl pyrophosphate synthase
MMATADGLETALAPIRRELDATSRRLLSQLREPLARRVAYLITAGGKRLRPALVWLTGLSGRSPDRRALTDAAAAVEMIHTATLIHDDIIDQSSTRRRRPTFHRRWGTERAVLTGDYLYATAFTLLADLRQDEPMRIIAEVCRQLSRGELLEVEARFRLDLSEDEYLEIIGEKTASLIAGCCRLGAVLGGVSAQQVERFGEFGWNFGLAFQIVDDCLDLTGDARQLGKSIHTDLDKGALSLPMIYLSATLTPQGRNRLFAPLRTRSTDPVFLARVARAAGDVGAIERALERASDFAAKAQASIHRLPLNGFANTYTELAEYVVSRRH